MIGWVCVRTDFTEATPHGVIYALPCECRPEGWVVTSRARMSSLVVHASTVWDTPSAAVVQTLLRVALGEK